MKYYYYYHYCAHGHTTNFKSKEEGPISPYAAEQVLHLVYMDTTHPHISALYLHMMAQQQKPWAQEPAFADMIPF
jgi:hypothetical protein